MGVAVGIGCRAAGNHSTIVENQSCEIVGVVFAVEELKIIGLHIIAEYDIVLFGILRTGNRLYHICAACNPFAVGAHHRTFDMVEVFD